MEKVQGEKEGREKKRKERGNEKGSKRVVGRAEGTVGTIKSTSERIPLNSDCAKSSVRCSY